MTSPDLSRSPNRPNRSKDAAVERVTAQVKEEELRQMNIKVPVEMHLAMRRRALDEGVTLRDWCLKLFGDALRK